MDGTLTVPVIDFHAMRSRTGITTGDLLDTIYAVGDESERHRLLDIIDQVEREANDRLQFQPNMEHCLTELHKLSLREKQEHCQSQLEYAAIVTRNSQESLQFFLDKLADRPFIDLFSVKLSRDFRPYKPSPEPLLHIARQLNIPPENCLMVGDSFHDIDSAKKTGLVQSCLFTRMDHWDEKHDKCVIEYEPDFVIHDLIDLVDIVRASNESA